MAGPSRLAVSDNWPDTEPGARTRKSADAVPHAEKLEHERTHRLGHERRARARRHRHAPRRLDGQPCVKRARRPRVLSCARYRESPARRSPPRRALVPPRTEPRGANPCARRHRSHPPPDQRCAIHRERLNEPEVALARCESVASRRPAIGMRAFAARLDLGTQAVEDLAERGMEDRRMPLSFTRPLRRPGVGPLIPAGQWRLVTRPRKRRTLTT